MKIALAVILIFYTLAALATGELAVKVIHQHTTTLYSAGE